jgi:hypothetical protein
MPTRRAGELNDIREYLEIAVGDRFAAGESEGQLSTHRIVV